MEAVKRKGILSFRDLGRFASFCLLSIALLKLGWGSFQIISLDLPISLGEGEVLDQAVRLAHGQSLYPSSFGAAPFFSTVYPPLYQLIQVPFVWVFGSAFWYGRLVSVCALLVCCWLVFQIVHELTTNRASSYAAVIAFSSVSYVPTWGALFRVDALALLFSILALFLTLKFIRTQTKALRYLVPLCVVAAGFTRQTSFVLPLLASVGFLLVHRRFRDTVQVCCLVALGGLSIFGVLDWTSEGGFYLNVVSSHLGGHEWGRLIFGLDTFVTNAPIQTFAILVLLFFPMQPTERGLRLYGLIVLAASVPALISVVKPGSSYNYLLELTVAGSIGWGLVVHLLTGRRGMAIPVWASMYLLTGILLYQAYQSDQRTLIGNEALRREALELRRAVLVAPKPILADLYYGIDARKGESRFIFQAVAMRQMERLGLLTSAPLVKKIYQEAFSFILLEEAAGSHLMEDRWSPEVLAAVHRCYKKQRSLAGVSVYVPAANECLGQAV